MKGTSSHLITIHDMPLSSDTTHRVDYAPKDPDPEAHKAVREQIEDCELYEQARREIEAEFSPPTESCDYQTTTKKDYFKDYTPIKPPCTCSHDFRKEQPCTFWQQHRQQIHGVSQVKTGDTPFRRNAAFSTPVELSMNSTQPYDGENWPKM
jgi:hypothetical protein